MVAAILKNKVILKTLRKLPNIIQNLLTVCSVTVKKKRFFWRFIEIHLFMKYWRNIKFVQKI